MDAAVEEIRFLADSGHRVAVLETLADGARPRDALLRETGASSATVGRILRDFETREWVVRRGHAYELTATGAFVAEAFAALHGRMHAAMELRHLLPYVPLEAMGLEAECLVGATVTRATPENPMAIISRVREYELESAASKTLAFYFPEPCIDARSEAVTRGTQTFEAVFTPEVVSRALASGHADKFEAMVAADRARIYVYEEEMPHSAGINDGVAYLIVKDGENTTIGVIESADERLVGWVEETFAFYRERARELSVEDLSPRAE